MFSIEKVLLDIFNTSRNSVIMQGFSMFWCTVFLVKNSYALLDTTETVLIYVYVKIWHVLFSFT